MSWYDGAKRDLPWRETKDPYCIWLSEIILQQTRVDQGMPYYERFVAVFPTVHDLANATEDEVLKLWEGLGYYSRARNLHATAKFVAVELDGKFPSTHEGLLALKGIGPYTAAAIGSIAFNLAAAAVDGNVYRVLARFYGISASIDDTSTKNEISRLANEIVTEERAGDHNQAMMELGATVCTPKQPSCKVCPLSVACAAYRLGLQSALPVRTKKTKVRERFFYYTIHLVDGQVPLKRRGDGDIWHGLYEFPLFESDCRLNEEDLIYKLVSNNQLLSISEEYKHILSHQRILGQFLVLSGSTRPEGNYTWVNVNDLSKFALPRLLNRYLEKSFFVINEEVSNL
ncbi:MAG: A/G-specific adenine glycosylase [Flavobacteriales bacterium]|nr:A/G-specific adenine glycosylase [Flavobacteriales bacterium]